MENNNRFVSAATKGELLVVQETFGNVDSLKTINLAIKNSAKLKDLSTFLYITSNCDTTLLDWCNIIKKAALHNSLNNLKIIYNIAYQPKLDVFSIGHIISNCSLENLKFLISTELIPSDYKIIGLKNSIKESNIDFLLDKGYTFSNVILLGVYDVKVILYLIKKGANSEFIIPQLLNNPDIKSAIRTIKMKGLIDVL